ncbi:MAG: hypothetical protein EHM14_01845 [Methanothrix sp.]|nr:MAG: hypothetical protein EHM14_01845 [Methanothrix sp.]
MRYAVVALLIIFSIGLVSGYPLHGSNGAINCTIFGSFKDRWDSGNANADLYAVLHIDTSLVRVNASDIRPIQASYTLTDGNDRLYSYRADYTEELQQGRRLIGFVVPVETIIKSLTVDLGKDPSGGEQFTIPFPEVSNSSNANVTLLYYGVLRSWTTSNKKTIEFDIGVINNDTTKLPLDERNFSLIDQWGWKYGSVKYDAYGRKGIVARELKPNETLRTGLIFSPISLLSRPVELIYQYSNNSSLAVNVDTEEGLCSRTPQEKECTDCATAGEEAAPSTLAGSIKASKARLAKVKGNITEGSENKGRDDL